MLYLIFIIITCLYILQFLSFLVLAKFYRLLKDSIAKVENEDKR